MSRIGKMPIQVPSGTNVEIQDGVFTAQGPKGKVEQKLVPGTELQVEDGVITVSRQGETGPEMGTAEPTGAPPGQWEWFSASRGRVVATPKNQRPPDTAPDDWILLTEPGAERTDDATTREEDC